MAQDITLLGITYESVPAITLPNTSSQPVRFVDTSEGNATASDIAIGHTAFVNGERIEGTMEPPVRDVNFFDYDGTLLYSYSAEEAATLTALPPNPTHEGLLYRGWNYTLSEMRHEVQVQGRCDIGQLFETDDGYTRIYVELTDHTLHPYLHIYLYNGAPAITINWGDGLSDTLSYDDTQYNDVNLGSIDQGFKMIRHDYAYSGAFTINIYHQGLIRFQATVAGIIPLISDNPSLTSMNSHYNYKQCVKKIELGPNVHVGGYAFAGLSALETVTFPFDDIALGTNILTSGATIYGHVFEDCSSLKWITIPSYNTFTTNEAIALANNCYSLKGISIPAYPGVVACGFKNCYYMRRLVIPSTARGISIPETGGYSTTGMELGGSAIEQVWVPDGITTIPREFLSKAYMVQELRLPTSITTVGSRAFEYTNLSEFPIPENVTTFEYDGSYCYYNMTLCQELRVPSGISVIGNYMFGYCSNVNSLIIPEGVTIIGQQAFGAMYALPAVTIPSTVTQINNSAFMMCKSLKELRLLPTTPPTLGSSAFSNLPSDCVIYVPHGCLAAYQAASGWSTYASQMIESAA